MTNIRTLITNAKLLQKASAVKFGWLAMEQNGRWFWYNKKPKWDSENHRWQSGYCEIANVKFLKLPKRKPDFAPRSLIKCTPRGPILLSVEKMYHRTWGMISYKTVSEVKKGVR